MSEYIDTVGILILFAVLIILHAISPRLAINNLLFYILYLLIN